MKSSRVVFFKKFLLHLQLAEVLCTLLSQLFCLAMPQKRRNTSKASSSPPAKVLVTAKGKATASKMAPPAVAKRAMAYRAKVTLGGLAIRFTHQLLTGRLCSQQDVVSDSEDDKSDSSDDDDDEDEDEEDETSGSSDSGDEVIFLMFHSLLIMT